MDHSEHGALGPDTARNTITEGSTVQIVSTDPAIHPRRVGSPVEELPGELLGTERSADAEISHQPVRRIE